MTEAARSEEQRARAGHGGKPRRKRRRWLGYLPILFALGAIAALLVYADPRKIGIAFERFNLAYVPIVVILSIGFYVVQGVPLVDAQPSARHQVPIAGHGLSH